MQIPYISVAQNNHQLFLGNFTGNKNPAKEACNNPDLLKQGKDLYGRLYIQIENYLEKPELKVKKANYQDVFEKTFEINSEKTAVDKFSKSALKIFSKFKKLPIVEQAHQMPENSKKLIDLFVKHIITKRV